ncbi:P1 family peptidase [Desulfoferrobacter suflitae]|uniref:P1 family peptidase n=1 Tax=Desulfoferrobacter suflitae TaxID=2865782 RepID=UPI002164329C|nr:P1 family peptidase [Desulfoferrobacter suflitae]MCK8600810.1 P1 family peptidase [Desulfoferrobacter suflitae]
MSNDTLTAIQGIQVGHASLANGPSGCTVILTRGGATAGVDVRGGAPGTYGTDTLNPLNLVDRVHGIFFTGGSAFGMSVAEGVRNYLSSRGIGFDSGHGLIPIVSGAVIFDLGLNQSGLYPDAALGFEACTQASSEPVPQGCVGAGTGASVGKLYGLQQAMKSGLGSACVKAPSGVKVAALMVVNAFGDVIDPALNHPIAGCRKSPHSLQLIDADAQLRHLKQLKGFSEGQNTVVGVVATNVKFTKTQLTKVAQMAHDGLARTVYPAHTQYDGDTIFSLSCGDLEGVEVSVVGSLAAQATARAILHGVRKACSWGRLPAFADLHPR